VRVVRALRSVHDAEGRASVHEAAGRKSVHDALGLTASVHDADGRESVHDALGLTASVHEADGRASVHDACGLTASVQDAAVAPTGAASATTRAKSAAAETFRGARGPCSRGPCLLICVPPFGIEE
jgi:hypothetical protein